MDLTDLAASASDTDLRTNLTNIFDNGSSNDPVIQVGSNYAMFRGNANFDLNLNQLDFGLTRLNSVPFQTGVYSPYDINMDANLNQVDFGLARLNAVPFKTAHIQ